MKFDYVNQPKIRRDAHAMGKRVGQDFLAVLDEKIRRFVRVSCGIHNGGKKTLDAAIARHVEVR